MVRLLFVSIAIAILVLISPKHANAYDTWCADDPVVWIGGHLLDVQVQVPVRYLITMRSTTLGSDAAPGDSTLTATCLPSRRSCAR